jgi:F-type H+-transporting ATPase subunit delta
MAVANKDELIRGYAEALLAVADAEGDARLVQDELFTFAKAVEANNGLRDALADPALPAENKKAVVRDLLGQKSSPHTANILGFLIDQGRTRDLAGILEELAVMAAERRQHVLAEVRSAVSIDEGRRAALATALSAATGRSVEVKVVVDPSVVGGAVTTIGDVVLDGTVRTRLREAGERLRGA